VAEMLIKIVSNGFIFNGETSYLRNSWNIMDFFIVAFALISIFASGINLSFIKVLRMLRVFRPLRMISRNEGLKLAVLSLMNAIPGIMNVLVISALFFLLFGILGVSYFKGAFFVCYLGNTNVLDIDTKWECVDNGGDWINKDANFDSVINSMITLFQMSTTENWNFIMF
jgi:hypothetical protein